MNTYCTSCGAEIPETNEYCTRCGTRAHQGVSQQPVVGNVTDAPVAVEPAVSSAGPQMPPQFPPTAVRSERSSSRAWIFVTLAIVVVMAAGSWAVIASNAGKKTQVASSGAQAATAESSDLPIPAGWVQHTREGLYSVYYPADWEEQITEDVDCEVTPWLDDASTGILCTPRLEGDTVEGFNEELIDWDKREYAPVTVGTSDWQVVAGETWLVTNYSLTLADETMAVRMFVTLRGDNAYVLQYIAPQDLFSGKWEDYFLPMNKSFSFYE